jgi:hypothetical protein
MNWRRGLFRLWVVGTVLFVLAVAFVSYGDIKEEFDAVAADVVQQRFYSEMPREQFDKEITGPKDLTDLKLITLLEAISPPRPHPFNEWLDEQLAWKQKIDAIGEIADQALKILLSLSQWTWFHSQQTWFRAAALAVGCFVAGFCLGWFLRGGDRTRAEKRKALGADMIHQSNYLILPQTKFPFSTEENAQIMSYFASANNLGIWAPDHLPKAARARRLITDYLSKVGTMLRDGNFREAKQYAKKSRVDFNNM